jgi:hypothetical protein
MCATPTCPQGRVDLANEQRTLTNSRTRNWNQVCVRARCQLKIEHVIHAAGAQLDRGRRVVATASRASLAVDRAAESDGRRAMLKFDIIAFARELDRLGLRLTTFRHLDGTVRLYQWRQMNYSQNEAAIRQLWNQHIGEDEKLASQLAESLENFGPKVFETTEHPTRLSA